MVAAGRNYFAVACIKRPEGQGHDDRLDIMLSKRFKLTTAAVVLAVGSVIAVPAAHADTVKCSKNVKKFNLPDKPDVTVTVNLCIKRSSSNGRITAYASMKWDGSWPRGTRFNDFDFLLLLERYDVTKERFTFPMDTAINSTTDGTRNFVPGLYRDRTARGGWSADGVITYDIAGDGDGNKLWILTGSPVIR